MEQLELFPKYKLIMSPKELLEHYEKAGFFDGFHRDRVLVECQRLFDDYLNVIKKDYLYYFCGHSDNPKSMIWYSEEMPEGVRCWDRTLLKLY